jgi:hypothetical protein
MGFVLRRRIPMLRRVVEELQQHVGVIDDLLDERAGVLYRGSGTAIQQRVQLSDGSLVRPTQGGHRTHRGGKLVPVTGIKPDPESRASTTPHRSDARR